MQEFDTFDAGATDLDSDAAEMLDYDKYPFDEIRQISSIPPASVFISADPEKRQQVYDIQINQNKMRFVRCKGIITELQNREFFFLDAINEYGQPITLAIRPELVWNLSGYWLNAELIQWSSENEDEIFNIIFYGLSSICDYFGWSPRALVPAKSLNKNRTKDVIRLMDLPAKTQVVVLADPEILDDFELRVRQYSVAYQKNCLWLGKKINFKLEVRLEPIRSTFSVQEIIDLNIGDLLPLKQNWPEPSVARLVALATCRSVRGNVWNRKIFMRIDNEDARMEFGNEDWELNQDETERRDRMSVTSPDGFKIGESGPDAVELEITVGTTTISFNELCNIQEGSLIEISRSTLPIVKMNVAGENVLEGELVRLGDQLMVQVTKKVG